MSESKITTTTVYTLKADKPIAAGALFAWITTANPPPSAVIKWAEVDSQREGLHITVTATERTHA